MSTVSRWASPPPVYDPARSNPHQHTTLTPYLTLPHLLSLTWLTYPILSLFFVAFRLQLSGASIQNSIMGAKDDLLSSCNAAERAATAAASMPRYLAVATNDQIVDAVDSTLNGAQETLILALTVMETIINFVIDTYRSTFFCFLELVVRGGLSVLIGAAQQFNDFLNSTLGTIRTNIQGDVAKANSAIQSAVGTINRVNPFGDISVPQFDIPSLASLQNVSFPNDFQNALINLNNSLPSVAELKDKVQSIVDAPFELLKQEINGSFAGFSFDRAVLPVPEMNNVSFCDDIDLSVIDDLAHGIAKIIKIGTLILVALALLLLAANCALEWYKWRSLQRHLRYTREAWTSDPTLDYSGSKSAPTIVMSDHNLLVLHASSAHPLLTRVANGLASLLRLRPSQHIHLRWFFSYIFHPPALACFLIGFFGLLSVQIQLFVVTPLARNFAEQALASVDEFTNTIATSINRTMFNQSAAYASAINERVDVVQSAINDDLFGWVNTTTSTLNDTINAFYTELQDAIGSVFNGTVLQDPVQDFIRCFIGSKFVAIENALTFLHNNLHINIPRVNESVLVLSPDHIKEATRPIALAAIGGKNDEGVESKGLVGRLVDIYVHILKKERVVFGIFFGIWGIVFVMGLCVIFWHSYGLCWLEAYKKRRWQKEQRAGITDIVIPFRDRPQGSSDRSREASSGGVGSVSEKQPIELPASKPGFLTVLRSPVLRIPFGRQQAQAHSPTEKSWDSFLDQADIKGAPAPSTDLRDRRISSPMKLVTTSMRKDPSNSGQTKAQIPWLKRTTSTFRNVTPNSLEQPADTKAQPELPRPNLSISTASSLTLPQSKEMRQSEAVVPMSIWSTSPRSGSTPQLSWILPTQQAIYDTRGSISGARSSLPLAPQPEPHFAVPLHHGFERPPNALPAPPGLSPPPRHPRRQEGSSQRRPAPHQRESLAVCFPSPTPEVDPFATPFDDNYMSASSANERRSTATNPFIALAI